MKETEDKLIEESMRLAYWTANKFRNCGIEWEDLNSIALLGLVKAAKKYDSSVAAFPTYAVRVMENEIRMEIRRNRKYRTISLEAEITISGEGNTVSLSEILPCREEGYDWAEEIQVFPALMDIKELKEKEKTAIRLIVCKEMKQREAADVMRVSQSAVSRYVKSGIKKMRAYLGGENEI